jgi:hypothetical protein
MEYVREFICEMTGDRVVIVKDVDGFEIALDFTDYINNHYSEAEHDRKQLWLEQN